MARRAAAALIGEVREVRGVREVRIAQSVVDEMLAHARADAPNECCGLLVGSRGAIERSIRARNRDSSSTRYLIDPDDHFAAIHAARNESRRVIGAYHSHPASAPTPSPSDIAEASGGVDFIYVIVSLVKPEGEVFAYTLKAGSVVPLELVRTTA
jgi:proteasome lid subunit RPN8/RPN11